MFEKHRVAPQLRGHTDAELAQALLRGKAMYQGGMLVPTLAGGDPTASVEDVLRAIDGRLATLAEQKNAGTDTSAEEDELKRQRQQLAAAASDVPTPPVNETAEQKLARLEREQSLTRMAGEIQKQILEAMRQSQADDVKFVTELVRKGLAEQLGEGGLDAAVGKALANARGGSRFAAEGAQPDVLEALKSGRGYTVEPEALAAARANGSQEDRELKSLVDSKSLFKFMQAVKNVRQGVASPAQRVFVLTGGTGDTKALAEGTTTAGGFLVRPEWMPDVLGLLRGSAVVRASGPRIQQFNKVVNQTQLTGGATAYYTAENAAIPKSEQTFGEVQLLTPHNLTGLVPVSNYLLGDDTVGGGAEEIVRQDLIVVMALREDLAFLRGTGASGEPTGFRNMAGITLNPLGAPPANGFQPTLAQLRRMLAVFRTQNAVNVRPVWFFNPAFLTYLEGLTDTLGRFLVDTTILQYNTNAEVGAANPGNIMAGTLFGAPFFATNQLPANLTQGTATNATDVFLVNIGEAVIGMNQELEIDMSAEASYTPDGGTTWINAFQNNQTLFRAVIRHDIAHRRPTQVLVQAGVLV